MSSDRALPSRFAVPMSAARRPRFEAEISSLAVLALFAWFALTACGSGDPGSPVTMAALAVHEAVEREAAAVTSVERPGAVDHTVGGTGMLGCTPDSRFGAAQGGDVTEKVKQSNDRLADEYKKDIEDAEKANKRCVGAPRGRDYYDQKFGCDRANMKNLEDRIAVGARRADRIAKDYNTKWPSRVEYSKKLSGFIDYDSKRVVTDAPMEEQTALTNEMGEIDRHQRPLREQLHREEAKCSRAGSAAIDDACSQANVERRTAEISAARVKLASVERMRDNAKRCSDDRKKQAQGPSSRPAIDPGTVLQTLPGIMGGTRSRPPSRPSSPPPPSHGH